MMAAQAAFAQTVVTRLTVEGRVDPVGLDEPAPRLGWQIVSSENDVRQTAYRVIISSSADKARKLKGDVWDSRRVKSPRSQWVAMPVKLHPDTEYYWRVKTYTDKGESEWSPVARWSTGLLSPANWAGEWIGLDTLTRYDNDSRHSRLASRYLRKEFKAAKPVRRATLHISGLGNYVAEINGQRVGDDELTPLPTDYTKTVAYDSYDVTPLIQAENAIGVALAGGHYFAQTQNFEANVRTTYGFPKLRANLIVEYTDGTRDVVATDPSWSLSYEGPVRYANEYDGELFDANRSLGDWTKAGYDDSKWLKARAVGEPGGVLRGSIASNMSVYEVEKPVAIHSYGDRHIIDFGTNNAGRVRLKINAPKGDTIHVRHAELLQKGDSLLYTANLRSAEATWHYVSDGKPAEYAPEFTYYGFRYAEVNGPKELKPEDITRELIADRMDDGDYRIRFTGARGHEAEAEMLNKIVDNARRGIRSNYKGMPLDCPQRDERMPWLGDRTTGCLGESYLMDNHGLYSKWIGDLRDGQRADGSVSDVTPAYWRLYNNNITWPAAWPFAAGMLRRQYGDERPQIESYEGLDRFMRLVHDKKFADGLVTYDRYGDWCVPPESPELIHSNDPARKTDGQLISTSYYNYLCRQMAELARKLDRQDDAKFYDDLAVETRKAINDKYLANGNYSNATVTANLMPLAMDIVPDSARQAVADNLITTIVDKNQMHLSAGVIGIQWLMRELSELGRGDIAYRLATTDTYPGWGYMVKKGATTIWELWNGDTANPAMNSGNHVMLLGDLLPWCFEYLAGIAPDDADPGFRHIVMRPDFSIEALDGVEASHPSPYGLIRSHWRRDGKRIVWDVTIPANTTATLYLPDGSTREVGSGNHQIVSGPEILPPVMGWSSWNTYHVNINEDLIKKQADAMAALGLDKLGYRYINVDDGFFGHRDATGKMIAHEGRFPNGMKPVADYIHSLGFKAGIYGEAGDNTCGSIYDNDANGVGSGLYGHELQDMQLFMKDWGFDFIKIDYCGGKNLGLDEEERYQTIVDAIKATGRDDVSINICRWAFPGTWARRLARSWRISPDIRPRWKSVKNIIEKNLYLSAYAGGGHYNDMDMLEVGRGLPQNEEEVHFGLWCIMASPLLIGCDMTTIPAPSLNLLKNEELIALNQDPLGLQAEVVQRDGDLIVLAKDIENQRSTTRAVALYNASDSAARISIALSDLELGGPAAVRDLVKRRDLMPATDSLSYTLEPHSVLICRLEGQSRLERWKFEAESACLPLYDDLGKRPYSIKFVADSICSGGMKVTNLGGQKENVALWDKVYSAMGGDYELTVSYIAHEKRKLQIWVNGTEYVLPDLCSGGKDKLATASLTVKLLPGYNTIAMGNDFSRAPEIDCFTLAPL